MNAGSHPRPAAGVEDCVALKCGSRKRTFAELGRRSDQFARALLGCGLEQNDRLAIICRNSIELVEIVIGAEKAGLRATIISPMAGRQDMVAALKCCDPHALIANVPSALGLLEIFPRIRVKLFVGRAAGFMDYEEFISNAPLGAGRELPTGVLMPLTSGTTGLPKAVYRSQAYLPPYLRQLLAATAFDADHDLAMAPCGLQGSGVYNLAVGLPIKAGVGVIIADISVTMDLDPEEVLRSVEQERVSHLYLPNYIMRRLLALPEERRRDYDLSSLKCILHTGSVSPITVKSALIDWLGPIVTEIYAGAEGGGTLIGSMEWQKHRGSVGKPADGLVRILNTEFEDVSPGAPGKVYFHVSRRQRFEYFNDPGATRQAYYGDYFTLGDLGRMDGDGYLYLLGRDAEVIVFSGYTVLPAEIDGVLLEHDAVRACAALGLPDDEMGEVVGAVVVLHDGFAPNPVLTQELLQWCMSRLSFPKCPRKFVYCNDIPGFAQGKVNRKALRGFFD